MIVIKKKKNNTKYIIIAIAIIAIIMIGVLCILINSIVKSTQKGTKTNTNTNSTTTTSEQTDEEQISEEDEIKQLSESARMKRYIGNFFNNIEDGDYQSAYNVLNEDFKKTYFSNLDEFTTYAKKYFGSSMLGITYDNIERLGNNKTGNMYVLLLTISNIFQGKLDDDEKLPQTYFVIVEKNYNDYEMSFSVNDVE